MKHIMQETKRVLGVQNLKRKGAEARLRQVPSAELLGLGSLAPRKQFLPTVRRFMGIKAADHYPLPVKSYDFDSPFYTFCATLPLGGAQLVALNSASF